jgi:hypothetical protein
VGRSGGEGGSPLTHEMQGCVPPSEGRGGILGYRGAVGWGGGILGYIGGGVGTRA